ncbi:DUF1294 domain-containing protein [Caldibacillus lycopersici]|uniref:DUF1294 domain-containing protein n=1 Tax=Perspicuibacillus lycopersici TaxID=1325689 RepID=A0AAE3IV49_9BACI|nr:DUF1294 domain-containing protein [Perspicuibacillus lycopersici]MCU9614163.1 DUF1294 domain-containing protein [Perspicuibacillus lycopersici]
MKIISITLLFINLIGFLLMGIDKKRARKHQWRIKESTLWLFAFIGGGVGTTIGMYLFHHKTKHTSFKLGFPFLAIIQVVIVYYLYNHFR